MTTPSGGTPGTPGAGWTGYPTVGGAGQGGPGGPGGGQGQGSQGGGQGVPTSGAPQVGAAPATGNAPRPPTPGATPGAGSGATATSPRDAGGSAAAQPLRATAKSRRARLVVRRVDPWSVLKFTLLFSICLLIVFVVAVAALFFALDALGVFESVNDFVRDLTQSSSGGRTTGGVEVPFTAGRVVGVATVIGLINVVLITAISTLGAFLYNLCSDIVGGIEVTLAERE